MNNQIRENVTKLMIVNISNLQFRRCCYKLRNTIEDIFFSENLFLKGGANNSFQLSDEQAKGNSVFLIYFDAMEFHGLQGEL